MSGAKGEKMHGDSLFFGDQITSGQFSNQLRCIEQTVLSITPWKSFSEKVLLYSYRDPHPNPAKSKMSKSLKDTVR